MVLRKKYERVLVTFTVAVEIVQADFRRSVARIIIGLISDLYFLKKYFSFNCMSKYILIF